MSDRWKKFRGHVEKGYREIEKKLRRFLEGIR